MVFVSWYASAFDEPGFDLPLGYGLQYHPRVGWYVNCVLDDGRLGMVSLTDEQALDWLFVCREEAVWLSKMLRPVERVTTDYVQVAPLWGRGSL